jgi:hypothetical protein
VIQTDRGGLVMSAKMLRPAGVGAPVIVCRMFWS